MLCICNAITSAFMQIRVEWTVRLAFLWQNRLMLMEFLGYKCFVNANFVVF